MKKIVIISAVFCFLSVSYIQAGIRLGLKAGVNLANMSFNQGDLKSSNFTGIQVGPIVEFSIPLTGIALDAAVLYSRQGLKADEQQENTLNVPVNLKIKIALGGTGVFFTAGPYATFKLSGGDFYKMYGNLETKFESKSFGAGINAGGGVELLKHLQIGVNYGIGLTDDYKSVTGNFDIRGANRIWSIAATYFF
ncbi:MAG: porin family protein [Dysgonamonadaceae bacterium]|jgi:hypothetical protein|nr:porin family protein [Dysgonamonadaceae bacterium]